MKFLLDKSNFNSPPHSGQKLANNIHPATTNKRFSRRELRNFLDLLYSVSIKFSSDNRIDVHGNEIDISINRPPSVARQMLN
jgi:hypothetical protein